MVEFRDAATTSFSGRGHDHKACVTEALDHAERVCGRRRARLTKLRRRVLELIWEGHAPVGAYDLLRRLSREREGAAPPTVYRALEFLVEHGLVHRIESLNAFVGCPVPAETHAGQFLICRRCGAAAEMHESGVRRAIRDGAAELGFTVEHQTVEVHGRCPKCGGAASGERRNGD